MPTPARSALIIALLAGWSAPAPAQARSTTSALTPDEARDIAREAYIYGFPLVDNYRVMHSYFVDRGGREFKARWNEIHNEARVYTPDDKAIQTPNSDTPYSQLGTDLRAEPLVVTVPAIEKERYYSLQFIDAYTFNYAYVGSRATGNEAGNYLVAGPRWEGERPPGIKAVIRSESEIGWILFRTQLLNPGDIENVRNTQSGYRVRTLSSFLGTSPPRPPSAIEFPRPLAPAQQRTSPEFFEILNFVLRFCPTHPSEQQLMARFGRLGIGPSGSFETDRLTPELRQAVEAGMADAWKQFDDFKQSEIDTGKRTAADGFGTRAFLGNDYMARMASAVLGIYGNSKEEALYPAYFTDAEGQKLDASRNRYTLRFAPDQLPPVKAFWSLTMYELPSSLLVANPLDRYLINSPMLPRLARDPDGGLTLYLQSESPGKDKESNWLPAPNGPFFSVMRLYWPGEDALRGRWKAPPLRRAATASASAAPDTGAMKASSQGGPLVPVNVDNFNRAETDLYFAATVRRGAFGRFDHNREATPIDDQTVVRMNRDTFYSAAVFDLDAGPVTITLPNPGQRFLSMQVINQDHYTPMVVYGGGEHTLSRSTVGTRYVLTAVRILVDPNDAADVARVHRLQDAIRVRQAARGTFEIPRWDPASQTKTREALNVLADAVPDKNRMFGTKAQVDPVRRLLGTASAWGGNPDKEAVYLNVTPTRNDGATVHRLTVRDVPVDGFWSVSVYNARGYYEKNAQNAYSLNNIIARKGADGAVAIQFGGCDQGVANCLPITPGWNYMVRLYRPRAQVLDGRWKFPEAQAVR